LRQQVKILKLSLVSVVLSWIFYATTVELIWMFWALPLPTAPVEALEPFRIANRYGLFASMTRGRYEIEFQGSEDGKTWVAYPFRYKPQNLSAPPGIYAPYQPRFDWNLWFASSTEVRLLSNDKDVLTLFEKLTEATKSRRRGRSGMRSWSAWPRDVPWSSNNMRAIPVIVSRSMNQV
jgi:lipase maturation factor 1